MGLEIKFTGPWNKVLGLLNSKTFDQQVCQQIFDDGIMNAAQKTGDRLTSIYAGGKAGGPPLAKATIKRKGNSKKLVETGRLAASVIVEREGKRKVFIGVGKGMEKIASYHENGTASIPARPVFAQVESNLEGVFYKEVFREARRAIKDAT